VFGFRDQLLPAFVDVMDAQLAATCLLEKLVNNRA
jgi:hypothetical protein